MSQQVGVDIGGTFTDSISIDPRTNEVRLGKVPTTPQNQAFGFLNALRSMNLDLPEISWLVHGTTVGTNATLERKGAKVGMITTRGFRDVLELGRRDRPQLYGLYGSFTPLVQREHRVEVSGRIDGEGKELEPLDEEEIERAIDTLKRKGVESLLIGFMHSYANRKHEERAAKIARKKWGAPYITTSADILGEFREFERFGTGAVNAYIQPLIHRYVMRLREELSKGGVNRDLAIMQANGGIMASSTACQRSVGTVLSGPAAGVIAANYIARLAGFKNVVTCDMGGTSFDVGMIVEGKPVVSSDRDLAFNIPLRIPILDIHTIGAGGGSIARIDEAGILKVGPESAGAVPGPIAYGRGGEQPTVTDANVLLGRLASDKLLAVEGAVDLDKLRRITEQKLGKRLGLEARAASAAVIRVINDAMASAIRLVTLQRGHDPREFALFAFGGAGPLHGVALARDLGVPTVIVPYVPGITCALGCIVADVRHDFVQTIGRAVDELSEADVTSVLDKHRAQGESILRSEQTPVERVEVEHEADMQYEGQTYTLRIKLERNAVDVAALKSALHQAYIRLFGIDLSKFRARLINLRTAVIGIRPELDLKRIIAANHKAGSLDQAKVGVRKVWFEGRMVDTPIYDRDLLPIGATFAGPAIVNQMDSTTVVEPGNKVQVDDYGNLIIRVQQ